MKNPFKIFLLIFAVLSLAKADIYEQFLGKIGDTSALKSYFKPSQGCKIEYANTGSDCCVYSDGERFCSFELIKPLNAQGKLIFRSDIATSEADGDGYVDRSRMGFYADFKAQGLSATDASVHITDLARYKKEIESKLPAWFKEGFLGEVSFNASFELVNAATKDSFTLDKNIQRALLRDMSAGADMSVFNVANLKLEFLGAKPYDRTWYEKRALLTRLVPNTKDAYVNLRKAPKGEVLTQIQMKDKNFILILNLDALANKQKGVFAWQRALENKGSSGDFDSSAWIKVAYFPKGVNDISKALIGYIHKSQVVQSEQYSVE